MIGTNYFLIIIAAVFFSLQFLLRQQFQKNFTEGFSTGILFSLYSSLAAAIILFLTNGLKMKISMFSIGIAAIMAIINILFSYASVKAFESANLSVYAVFSMLGGMILPFFYGVFFSNESINAMKILCCILIMLALYITVIGEKNVLSGLWCYIMIFVLNGMVGVVSKIHQSNTQSAVDSGSFLIITNIITAVFSAILLLIIDKKITLVCGKPLLCTAGYAFLCGVGNLFVLIALTHLPASVQYPIITGGVMVFTTIISLIRREAVRKNDILSTVIAFVASVLIAL